MKIRSKIFLMFAAAAVAAGCERGIEEIPRPMPELIDEAQFSVPTDATRTVIGDDGRSVYWEVGDRLALWALDNASEKYVAEGVQFMLRHFSPTYTQAFFAGNIAAQNEKSEYTYYMCSPMPKTVSGTEVTYTLPAEQNGKYQSSYDIMVARALEAGAITPSKNVELNTSFIHQMHALKITVPEGKNTFGHEFNRLEIIFPQPVVGDITFDVSDPEAEPIYTNTSNTITVYNPDGLRVGEEFWVFVLPGTVSGNIKYRVVASDCRSHYNEVSSITNKRLLRGHVTPIKMTTPELEPYMIINFSIDGNNLGEKVDKVTVLAPNGSELGSFVCNNEDTDIFTLRYDTINNDIKNYQNNNFTIRYESAHAIVENTLYVGTLNEYAVNNTTPMVVPYLLYEDFSTLGDYTDEATTGAKSLDLPGWSASRSNCKSGVIRLAPFWAFARFQSRLDSAPISSIKENANISISFDANNNISNKKDAPLQLGYGTAQGAIKSDTAVEQLIKTETVNKGESRRITYTINNFPKNGRLAWRTELQGSWGTYNYVGIDNIIVQIIP